MKKKEEEELHSLYFQFLTSRSEEKGRRRITYVHIFSFLYQIMKKKKKNYTVHIFSLLHHKVKKEKKNYIVHIFSLLHEKVNKKELNSS